MSDGTPVEELKIRVVGDVAPLDSSFSTGIESAQGFVRGMMRVGQSIKGVIDDTLHQAGDIATGLKSELRPVSDGLRTLTETMERYIKQREGGTNADRRATSEVVRLRKEVQAGIITEQAHIDKLRELVKTSEQGSAKQIAAQIALRRAESQAAKDRDRETRESLAAEKSAASEREKIAAQIARDEAQATKDRKREIQEVVDAEKAAEKERERNADKLKTANEKAAQGRRDLGGKVADGVGNVGSFLTKTVSAPIIAGGTYSIKTRLDFDDAAQEVKTFGDMTEQEFAKIKKELLDMSTEQKVDMSFPELTKLAALGEQLGVEKGDIIEFVRNIAALQKSGDISGEAGAEGMAKLAAALDLPLSKVKNMSSSLAAMGKLGASSLSGILDTSLRFAASAKFAGLKPDQIFAFSNAIVSMGQNAEAGGTAFDKVLNRISRAVIEGGDNLKIYAQVAGMSAKDFARAFKEDAGGAISAFLDGLHKQSEAGHELLPILDALGIKQQREAVAVKNLASNRKLSAEVMQQSATAYKNANVHFQMAAKATDTDAAALRNQRREVQLAAYEIGGVLLPVLRDVLKIVEPNIKAVQKYAQEFAKLSPEQQKSKLMLVAWVVALGPLLMGLASGAKFVLEFTNAWRIFAASQAGIQAALAATATAETGVATAGIAAFAAGAPLFLAIAAIVALVATLAKAWYDVKTAQDDAAQSELDYANKKKALTASGPKGELIVKKSDNAAKRSALKDQLAQTVSDPKAFDDYVGGKKPFDYKMGQTITAAYRKKGKDLPTDMGGGVDWWSAAKYLEQERDVINRQLAALDADDKRLSAEQKQIRATSAKQAQAAGKKFSTRQKELAKLIQETGAEMGASPKHILAAIETALVESDMSNMAGGDRDSAGVFQQRPSQDWGTYSQVTDPSYAARAFFAGAGTNKGVLHYKDFKGSAGQLSQTVQRSAFPDRYDKREGDARALLAAIGFTVPGGDAFDISNSDVPNIVVPGKKGKKKPTVPEPIRFLPPLNLSDDDNFFGSDAARRLAGMPTDAANYKAKMEAIDAAASDRKLAGSQSGEPFDDYHHETNLLGKRIETSSNALRNIDADIERLEQLIALPKSVLEELQAKMKAAMERSQERYRAGDIAGVRAAKSDYAELQKEFGAARTSLSTLKGELKQNLGTRGQVVSDLVGDKTKLADITNRRTSETRQKLLASLENGLKSGEMTRPQYERAIADAMQRIGSASPDYGAFQNAYYASTGDRERSERDFRKKTLRTESSADGNKHKDFEVERMELDEEIEAFRQAGDSEVQIAAYKSARLRQISHAEFEQTRTDAEETHKAMMQSGEESLVDYRAFQVSELALIQKEYGETSAEAKKAALAISDTDWEIVRQQADGYRQSLDDGAISLQAYTARLYDLRTALPSTSQEYKSLSSEIRQAERSMRDARRQTADEWGSKIGDLASTIFKDRSKAGQAVKEMFTSSIDDAIKEGVKRNVSKLLMNLTGHKDATDKVTEAAQLQNTAADKMLEAANKNADVAAGKSGAAGGAGAAVGGAVGQAAGVVGGLMNTVQAMGGRSGIGATLPSLLGKAQAGIGAVGDVAQNLTKVFGKNSGTAKSAAGLDKMLGGATKWLGYAGAAYTAYSVVKALTGTTDLGFQSKQSSTQKFSQLASGDHTGLFDTSSVSGIEGLRKLEKANRDANGSGGNVQHIQNIHPGAIVIQGAGHSADEIATTVLKRIADQTAMDNGMRGND